MSGHTPIDFKALSSGEIEDIVDKGLRHRTGKTPRDYLEHWLYIGRHFGYATHDDSWGEFEKEFAIIIKRLVVGEREAAANEAKIEALENILRRILKHGELGNVGTGGWAGNKPAGNPMSKDVWQFPRHMLTDIDAALLSAAGEK